MLTDSESALARAVLVHGPISRTALAERLALSPASLTRLAKPFVDRGVFVERPHILDGLVGRPVTPLDVASEWGRFAGVKLTGDRAYAVLTDARADVLSQADRALDATDPEGVVALIVELVRGLVAEATGDAPLRAAGVSVGGTVRAGRVEFAPFLAWTDVDLANLVSARLGVPVTVENDVVALTEAEHWFGKGRGIPGFSLITVGAGIGHGLVVDDRVVRTTAGVDLVGHVPVSAAGPICPLGHRGCAQMLTTASVLAAFTRSLGRPVAAREALVLARAGDETVVPIVSALAEALGNLLALVAGLTQQSVVVLAGEGIDLAAAAEERVRAAITAARDPRADPVTLHVDDGGFTAWARGAAAVAIQAAVDRIDLRARTSR
ncbi:ROK family transcriptional regulator [Microbacterium invictum]|uniref:ROK family transcriptional regulator n=1 Tax=Microbacterium invictum TaxID=515415 RepID=A0ABZ0VCD9_9MICO|nr:ROK family transcriptional regulator [Microbacterium invictum]WQB71144.1 ROK family transcriptional regulator [Microbacterium invictum]